MSGRRSLAVLALLGLGLFQALPARGSVSSEAVRPLLRTSSRPASAKSIRELTPEDFKVESLPGLKDEPSFAMYAGFMPLANCTHKKLFFWFVESERDPAGDPLVLWMNGG